MARIVLLLTIFTSLAGLCVAFPRTPAFPRIAASLTTTPSSESEAFPGIIPALVPLAPYVPMPLHFPGMQSFSSPETAASAKTKAPPRTATSPQTVSPRRTLAFHRTSSSPATAVSRRRERLSTTSSARATASVMNTAFPMTTSSTKTITSPRTTSLITITASSTTAKAHRTKPTIKATSSKPSTLQKFAAMLKEECNFDMLDEVAKDLKDLWAKVMKEEEQTSRGMDVREYLRNLIDDYNKCCENSPYMDFERQWAIYLKIFGKEYTAEEQEMKKTIFKSRKEDMEKHNELYRNGLVSHKTNLNELSDWTEKELGILCGFQPSNETHHFLRKRNSQFGEIVVKRYNYNSSDTMPAFIDWSTKGYVNPVKHQGKCGCCYAMGGLGALEAYHKKRSGELAILSTQNILDCTWHLGNKGCATGFHDTVFMYAETLGVVSNFHYPYTMNASHDCLWRYEHVVATDEGYYIAEKNNELALQHAVANHGPVAVAMGTKHLFAYRSEVFNTKECGNIDHTTLVVGYGTDPVYGDYWIAKNSWGYWWGEDGYVRMARNKNNMCQIAKHPSFPL